MAGQRGELQELLEDTEPGAGDELLKNLSNESPLDQSVGENTDEMLGLKTQEEEEASDADEEEDESQAQETKSDDEEEEGAEEGKEDDKTKETKSDDEEGTEDADGVAEDDIDAAIKKHLQSRGKPEEDDQRRSLLMGRGTEQQQQQTQQTQQQSQQTGQEEDPLAKPFDYAPARKAIVDKFGEEYGKVADELEEYMKPIIAQAGERMEAMVHTILEHQTREAQQVQQSYQALATDFWKAYPELGESESTRALVFANMKDVMSSGKQFANQGEMLYEVGQISLQQLQDIKGKMGGGGEKTKTKTSKRTKAASVGKNGARSKRQEEQDKKQKNASDASMDNLFDYAAKRYERTGVLGHVN